MQNRNKIATLYLGSVQKSKISCLPLNVLNTIATYHIDYSLNPKFVNELAKRLSTVDSTNQTLI